MSNFSIPSYEQLGQRVGALVDTKNKAYGSAFDDAGNFLKLLYPNGIQPSQYGDALALVRIFDKMKRIATDRDAMGESPYQDIAGYGLLGLRRVETERSALQPTEPSNTKIVDVSEPCSVSATMGDRLILNGYNGLLNLADSFQKTADALSVSYGNPKKKPQTKKRNKK